MKKIDPKKQSKKDNYKLLIGSVVPRPIAFVTSITDKEVVNAAPFSFFNAVASDPVLISISCGRKPGGKMKDTARNILENKEFVVHVVDESNVNQVNDTAVEFPSDVSEVEEVGFTLIESSVIRVPRIAESKVHMECVLHQILPMGGTAEKPSVDFIIGEVVQFHVHDDVYHQGRIDTKKVAPVGRLAGTVYCKVGETFSLSRPSLEEWKSHANVK